MEEYRRRTEWKGIVVLALAFVAAPAVFPADDPPQDETKEAETASEQTTEQSSSPSSEPVGEQTAPAESPLVRAAKASRTNSDDPGRVYTNDDVAKSKGSLIVIKEQPPITAPAEPDADDVRARSDGRALDKVKKDYEAAIEAAEEEIARLVEEQHSLEDGFYEEVDDPADREAAEERFGELQKQIDQKAATLDEIREKYQKFLVEYRKKTAVW